MQRLWGMSVLEMNEDSDQGHPRSDSSLPSHASPFSIFHHFLAPLPKTHSTLRTLNFPISQPYHSFLQSLWPCTVLSNRTPFPSSLPSKLLLTLQNPALMLLSLKSLSQSSPAAPQDLIPLHASSTGALTTFSCNWCVCLKLSKSCEGQCLISGLLPVPSYTSYSVNVLQRMSGRVQACNALPCRRLPMPPSLRLPHDHRIGKGIQKMGKQMIIMF